MSFPDLASSSLGTTIVAVTDEFFAPASNMINPAPPVHAPGKFVDTGAWMDGWESKRHNQTYDWCIIKLGFPGSLRGFDIDTHYFTGNQAPFGSVDAVYLPEGDVESSDVKWVNILPKVELIPNGHNLFVLSTDTSVFTHLRLNNIPDGGIARFRAYGAILPVWPTDKSALIDLASCGYGGRVVEVSDQHYTPASNILLPGRGHNMGDGWETKRSRVAGHRDYVIVKLADHGHLMKAAIDTNHFKGNYPYRISLEATYSSQEIPEENAAWTTLVAPSPVGPHNLFYFDLPHHDQVFSHAKISIIPDGGIKRLRLYGLRKGHLPVESTS